MAKDPTVYDGDDEALIRGWLDEPALGVALAAEVNWLGFFWDLDEPDPQPTTDPAAPTMLALCKLAPGGPPIRATSGDVARYRATLDMDLEIQTPAPTATATAMRGKVRTVDRAIRQHLDSKSTEALIFNPSIQLVTVKPNPDRGWPRYRRLIPFRG